MMLIGGAFAHAARTFELESAKISSSIGKGDRLTRASELPRRTQNTLCNELGWHVIFACQTSTVCQSGTQHDSGWSVSSSATLGHTLLHSNNLWELVRSSVPVSIHYIYAIFMAADTQPTRLSADIPKRVEHKVLSSTSHLF